MLKIRTATVIGAMACSGLASAAGNLLANGSFEQGLAGWQVGQSGDPQNPPVIVTFSPTAQTIPAAFGSVVTQNNAVSSSPDSAGTKGLLFVEDAFVQTSANPSPSPAPALSWQGSMCWFTQPGYNINSVNARLSITGGGSGFTFNQVSTNVAPDVAGVWRNFQTSFNAQPGTYIFTFSFSPFGETVGVPARDFAVDQAFVVAVPEPETYALALVALLTCGALVRRQRRTSRIISNKPIRIR